eukprot:2918244-Rhodomonas_salina.2
MTRCRAAESSDQLASAETADLTQTPQDSGESVRDPNDRAQQQRQVDSSDPTTWFSGPDVPLTVSISTMTDKQLGRALAHYKFVFKLPKEWWYNEKTAAYKSCTAVASNMPTPAKRVAHKLQFPIGANRGFTKWNVQRFLATRFDKPQTLADVGLVDLLGQPGMTASLATQVFGVVHGALTPEQQLAVSQERNGLPVEAQVLQKTLGQGSHSSSAQANLRQQIPSQDQAAHDTGELKSLKTLLMVMGNQMKQGKLYVNTFAPVPHSTTGRVMMSLAAAMNLEMHCVDLSQAFIQASWADLRPSPR